MFRRSPHAIALGIDGSLKAPRERMTTDEFHQLRARLEVQEPNLRSSLWARDQQT